MKAIINFEYEYLKIVEEVFQRAANFANGTIGRTRDEKQRMACKDGGYKCIHLPLHRFLQNISFVIKKMKWAPYQLNNIKFLDVGCGVGQKPYMAKHIGFKAFGLELRIPLISAGKKAIKSLGALPQVYSGTENKLTSMFIQGNALTFDRYNEFDLIYYYCPLSDYTLQQQLEQRIAETAKQGAIVVGCLSQGIFATFNGENDLKALGWRVVSGGNHGLLFFIRDKVIDNRKKPDTNKA